MTGRSKAVRRRDRPRFLGTKQTLSLRDRLRAILQALPDDPTFERLGDVRPRVADDPVSDLVREIEAVPVVLEAVDDPK